MKKICFVAVLQIFVFSPVLAQTGNGSSEMAELLATTWRKNQDPHNPFASAARIKRFTNELANAVNIQDSAKWAFLLVNSWLEEGDEKSAIKMGEFLQQRLQEFGQGPMQVVRRHLALAYLRDGEKTNCVLDHNGASCIFPISGRGIQTHKTGSQKAIELYEQVLAINPNDLESRWLLNVAYMAIGAYPASVPQQYLIPDLDKPSAVNIKPFEDISMQMGLDKNNLAGGSIVDDFNNDGHLDIITSCLHLHEPMSYYENNGDGTFTDKSAQSGINILTGGLNLLQGDYNNDGFKDVFVLRGAWLAQYGEQPNSLLRNNGDGTFADVTIEAGMLSFKPTQTGTWADFNGDGWLDLFVGYETIEGGKPYPCELYLNNKNGTFTEIAKAAGCDITLYVKAVSSGDFDNDNKPDIYIATLGGQKILLRNSTTEGGVIKFEDVSEKAGLTSNKYGVFTSWFWDYDNDGWLDILTGGYSFEKSLAWHAGEESLDKPRQKSGEIFLFRNKHDGTFEEVSDAVGFNKIVFPMGGNFGDINNDGYLDFYLGSGNPLYQSLVPNKMYLNLGGKSFADVTTAARVGNLQKGHGVSFADFDNDGDQDIHIEMGGAFNGDGYANSLFINPGQEENNWIRFRFEGVKSNKAAIGAKVKLTIEEQGRTRTIYREVNSGGSFGCNPLMQHIGVGRATTVKLLQITWPGSKTIQSFKNLAVNNAYQVTEGIAKANRITLKKVDLKAANHHKSPVHTH